MEREGSGQNSGRNPPSNLSFSRAARISHVAVAGLIEIGVIQRGC